MHCSRREQVSVAILNRNYYHLHQETSLLWDIGYVNSQDWIDSVVIGVDNEKNLLSNLQSISMPLMSNEVMTDLSASRPRINVSTLDPANWKVNV